MNYVSVKIMGYNSDSWFSAHLKNTRIIQEEVNNREERDGSMVWFSIAVIQKTRLQDEATCIQGETELRLSQAKQFLE